MRLLHTTENRFEEFSEHADDPGFRFPTYATLSHRWGKDELTFEEMEFLLLSKEDQARVLSPRLLKLGDKVEGEGYQKVINFRQVAAVHGLQWVWVDTVCIDKSSSAEVSEAINSMWRWYENSTCYAYLADVAACPHGNGQGGSGPAGRFRDLCSCVQDSFKQSVWHLRGWTAQELMAPRSVIFLDASWKRLIWRSDCLDELALITGISRRSLHYRNFAKDCAAEKFSWVAKRRTSRTEDLAYCLLGLFDINMPLLYGEGRRAFRRLCEEILKATGDPTIFAHHQRSMFPRSPSDFVCGLKKDELIYRYQPPPSMTWQTRPTFTIVDRGVRITNIPCTEPFSQKVSNFYRIVLILLAKRTGAMIALLREHTWQEGEWDRYDQLSLMRLHIVSQAEIEEALENFAEDCRVSDEVFYVTDFVHQSRPWDYYGDISSAPQGPSSFEFQSNIRHDLEQGTSDWTSLSY